MEVRDFLRLIKSCLHSQLSTAWEYHKAGSVMEPCGQDMLYRGASPLPNKETLMKREDRLKEMERLWKSKSRNLKWEEIPWEPFMRSGQGVCPTITDDKVGYYLKKEGFLMWSVGVREIEGMDDFEWDAALLDWLHVWYSLPEEWETPFFVNEMARTICIPCFAEEQFALLFCHPDSVVLGTVEELGAFKGSRESAALDDKRSSVARSMNREEAMLWLHGGEVSQ